MTQTLYNEAAKIGARVERVQIDGVWYDDIIFDEPEPEDSCDHLMGDYRKKVALDMQRYGDIYKLELPSGLKLDIKKPTLPILLANGLQPSKLTKFTLERLYRDKLPDSYYSQTTSETEQEILAKRVLNVIQYMSADITQEALETYDREDQWVLWHIAQGYFEFPNSVDLELFAENTLDTLARQGGRPLSEVLGISGTITGFDLDLAGSIATNHFNTAEKQMELSVMASVMGGSVKW